MSPWIVLGWMVVGIVGSILFLVMTFLTVLAWKATIGQYLLYWKRHLKTRNIPPKAGQIWYQGNSLLRINRITEDGRVVMNIGNGAWSESPEEWKDRVKKMKLWLVQKEKRT